MTARPHLRPSEGERHAIAHAQLMVDRATPDNPEVSFDYELVASLLGYLARLRAALGQASKKENGNG